MNHETLDQLVADVKLLNAVFAGPIAAYKQREADYARQVARDKERANVKPLNWERNQARLAEEAKKAEGYAKPQSGDSQWHA